MVGGLMLYNARSRNIALDRSDGRGREWRAQESAAASPESNAALIKEYEGLSSLTSDKGHCDFGGKK